MLMRVLVAICLAVPTACSPAPSNGQVKITYDSGQRYVGQVQDGERNGEGTQAWPDGSRYAGHFQNDKWNGYGTFTWPDGTRYVGAWLDGKKNGQGTQYAANGQVLQFGMWAHGQFVGAAVAANTSPDSAGQNKVRLIKEGGTFKVPVLINGVIPLHFTVDSGAADVSIPADVVMTLTRMGTITNADFIDDQIYRLADGSTVKSKTFRIRQLSVGGRVVNNVLGSIAGVNGSLLLGQSFLSRFRKVSFDYNRGVLVLE
jgi:hypothetical protein